MGSEGDEAAANFTPEWDLAAEKELVAIEEGYFAKRKKSSQIDQAAGLCSPSHPPKARRLPDWTSPADRLGDHNDPASANAIPNPRNGVWNLASHVRPGYQSFLLIFHRNDKCEVIIFNMLQQSFDFVGYSQIHS